MANKQSLLISQPLLIMHVPLTFPVLYPLSPLLLFLFSILNKLTPEKFDKLCLELLNVGVDSKLVLKGVILLVI